MNNLTIKKQPLQLQSSARGRVCGRRLRKSRVPRGMMALNILQPNGRLWLRIHVQKGLWNAVEHRAAQEGITNAAVVNSAIEAGFATWSARMEGVDA